MPPSWLDPRRPWTVRVGDCRAAMADMDPDSVDATVTDTPYGLSTVLDPPRLHQEAAWAKIMAGREERARPLQEYLAEALADHERWYGDCPMSSAEMVALLTAAMETRRNLGSPFDRLLGEWLDTGENPRLKGRGFMGNEWDSLVPPPNTWRAVHRVQKPGSYLFAFAGARTHGLIDTAIRLADFEVDDEFCIWITAQGMPKRVRLDLKIDQHFGKAGERPNLGQGPHSHKNPNGYQNGNTFGDDDYQWPKGQPITGAATPEAARFVGWDRARRPAFEPVVVATKPLRGTIAENALRYGTGGLHVDACRIEREPVQTTTGMGSRGVAHGTGMHHLSGQTWEMPASGGYPANLILSEEAAAELDASVPSSRDGVAVKRNTTGKVTGRIFKVKSTGEDRSFGGEGGPSRFFYVAKAATSERDKGLEAMPVMTPGERSGREDGSAGINGYAGTRGEARNSGPCVKPITLMGHLVRMACPPGAWDPDPEGRPLVMDCFGGTMSTGVACMVEGMRFVGMEQSEEYAAIGRARLQHAYALPREAAGVDEVDGEAPPVATAGAQRTLF